MYDESYITEKPALESVFHEYCDKWYIKRMKISKIKSVLDIGGGDGRLTRKLEKAGFDVTYNDLSEELSRKMLESHNVLLGDFTKLTPQPKMYDCLLFSFGVLNHITIKNAWKVIRKWKPRLVLGWVSNKHQLEYYIKFQDDKLKKFLKNDYDYSLISQNQYKEPISGIKIHNYSYNEIIHKYFQIVKPYPTYLWLGDWKNPSKISINSLKYLDEKYPNKEFCSGFLVEKRFKW